MVQALAAKDARDARVAGITQSVSSILRSSALCVLSRRLGILSLHGRPKAPASQHSHSHEAAIQRVCMPQR